MGYMYLPCLKPGKFKYDKKFTDDLKCVNQWMIDNKYGREYSGGKKHKYTLEEVNFILSEA